MNVSELKPILQELVKQIEDLRVNEVVLLAMINERLTLGQTLEIRKTAESKTKGDLAKLRVMIDDLA